MGIQLDTSAFHESPQEREEQKRRSLRKRILILFSTLIVLIGLRLLIKDPPPPKAIDYSKVEVRYFPGMLDGLSPIDRAKLDPKVLAKMLEVDEAARRPKESPESLLAKGPYHPAELVNETDLEAQKYKEQLVALHRRQQQLSKKIEESVDITKPMLVRFNNGRYVTAEKAITYSGAVEVRFNRAMLARFPNRMVSSITADALTWQEPVPNGFVRMKPANGITIIVAEKTSRRISVKKGMVNEI